MSGLEGSELLSVTSMLVWLFCILGEMDTCRGDLNISSVYVYINLQFIPGSLSAF